MISHNELTQKMREKSDSELMDMYSAPENWSEEAFAASSTVLNERKIPVPAKIIKENLTLEMQSEEDERTYPAYKREIIIGISWVLFGLIATLISVMYTRSGFSSIFFGPVIYGAIKIGRADVVSRQKAS